MAFSFDEPSLANQVIGSIDLPGVEEEDLFDNRLDSLLKKIAGVVNTKTGGLFNLNERINFKQLFTANDPQTFRNVYRKTFDLIQLNGGNIAGGASVSFAHNIAVLGDALMIYVSCVTTDPEYFTAVYPDVYLTSTNIDFTNPHASAVTSAIAVAEYSKD